MADAALALPANLDTGSAGELAQSLIALRGEALTLDASGVQRVGALGLQVLLSARLTWARDGARLKIDRPSEALTAALSRAGLQLDFDRSARS